MPKFNAVLPPISWVDPGEGRYLFHPQTNRLRLDSESIISPRLVLVSWQENFGKSDKSKYLTGLRIKTSEYDPKFPQVDLIIQQYKATVPYSYAANFSYHFPISPNLWLMFATVL